MTQLGIADALSEVGRYGDSYPWFNWAMIVAGILLGLYIWFNRKGDWKGSIKGVTVGVGIVTAMLAQAGDALEQIGRYDTTRGVRDAFRGGNSAIYNYVQRDPMGALGYVHAFGDTSSTSRITSGAMIDSGRNSGGYMGGDLGYGYYTTWGNGFAGALGGPSGMAAAATAGGNTFQVKQN